MIRLLLATCLACGIPGWQTAQADQTAVGECAVLLHGLGRTQLSMWMIEESLEDQGYSVWNESYDSTGEDIPTLANSVIPEALGDCERRNAAPVHFVTHSMGGILLRQYLQDHEIGNLGNVVMISPPNQGSEVVDLLGELALFKALLGPAATQLGTDEDSVPAKLSPVDARIGIIAGTRSSDPWFSDIIEGEDDGKVSVDSTRLPEMADMVTVEHGHTFIMNQQSVIELVVRFLETGSFSP